MLPSLGNTVSACLDALADSIAMLSPLQPEPSSRYLVVFHFSWHPGVPIVNHTQWNEECSFPVFLQDVV